MMKQKQFEQQHRAEWDQLQAYCDAHPTVNEEFDFPRNYRQLCQHLALAKARHYSPALIEQLSDLAHQGYLLLHAETGGGWQRIKDYFIYHFPRAVRREWKPIGLAAGLFYGAFALMFIWIQYEPKMVYTLMDSDNVRQFETMYDPAREKLGRTRDAATDTLMFGYYIRNNTGIGLQVLAGGLLAGIGTLLALLFNGLYIGAVAGHLTHIGYGQKTFFPFVSGHSATELTAIVISGGAGFILAWALIAPGNLSRRIALRLAARRAMDLVWGFVVLFLLAASIEAYWSATTGIDKSIKYLFGISQWILLIAYLLLAGRNRGTG